MYVRDMGSEAHPLTLGAAALRLDMIGGNAPTPVEKIGTGDVAATLRHRELHDTAWGTVRWSRSLGRPRTATLAEGVEIRHKYTDVKLDGQALGRQSEHDTIWPVTPAKDVLDKWDVDDPDYYVVGYSVRQIHENHARDPGTSDPPSEAPNYIVVELAPVPWDGGDPSTLRLPPWFGFITDPQEGPIFLDPLEILGP